MLVRSDKRKNERVVLRVEIEDTKVFHQGDRVKLIDLRGREYVGELTDIKFGSFYLQTDKGPLYMLFRYIDWIGEYEEATKEDAKKGR